MGKISKTEQLFRTLPVDVQHDIEMQLESQFIDYYITADKMLFYGADTLDNIARFVSGIKRSETRRKRELTERWLKENETG